MFMKDSELWQEYSKRYVSSNEMATLILWHFHLCDKNNNTDPKRQFWGFHLLMHVERCPQYLKQGQLPMNVSGYKCCYSKELKFNKHLLCVWKHSRRCILLWIIFLTTTTFEVDFIIVPII